MEKLKKQRELGRTKICVNTTDLKIPEVVKARGTQKRRADTAMFVEQRARLPADATVHFVLF